MSNDARSINIWMRRWVDRQGDVQSHYENSRVEIKFPARFTVHYEPTQHVLVLRGPNGDVAAVYREITRMTTEQITETWE
jgi:hypothetical protein